MKIAIIACLSALAAAEADAWYGPYGYSYMGQSWPMYSSWNSWNYRPGYSYGKRSADAEAEAVANAEPEADSYYRPYYNFYNNRNMGFNLNRYNQNQRFNWNRYNQNQRFNYGKRSADAEAEAVAIAEPEADSYYRPYYNFYNNRNMGFNL